MQFLNPIWLTALVALSIPVVIHLWNIRPGKTLKVGSISIFAESSSASSRSFQLLDILLLILRCLLLAIMAIMLATPFWQQKADQSSKGWILIPQKYFGEAYHQYKSKIDSLNNKGYEFHYFAADFPKQQIDKILKDSLPAQKTSDYANYWLLAALLDKQVPAAMPIEIFTPGTSAHFQGNQPGTMHHFKWHTFIPADSVKTWLNSAWVTANGAIRIAQGTGKPAGIGYQFTEVRNDDSNPLFDVKTTDGKATIALKSNDTLTVPVNNHVAELAIYAGDNEADANYLRAALEAASRFMLARVQVKVYHQAGLIPAEPDWLFWLSDLPVQAKKAHHILYYAEGKASVNDSWLVNNGDTEHPQLFKSIPAKKTDEQPVWTDGSGHIVLGKKQSDAGTLYPFYSRFNPTWNDLVWNDAFPSWLLQLLTPEVAIDSKNDARSIDIQQIEPHVAATNTASFQIKPNNTNLSQYLWYVLALLFFAERWITHQTKFKLING